MGRRRNDDFEGLIGPIAVLLVLFGAVIVAFLKALVLIALTCGVLALIAVLVYRLGREFWEYQLNIEAYLPGIDWEVRSVPPFDSGWLKIRYPEFRPTNHTPAANVIGTSGAWKDVVGGLERFPALRGVVVPRELQERIAACEAAAPAVLQRALREACELAKQKQPELEQAIRRSQAVEQDLNARVRPKLDMLRSTIEAMQASTFFDRLRAPRLARRLSEYEVQLRNRCREAREKAGHQEQAVRRLLDPALREREVQARLQQDLAAMKEIVTSKEFAGAVAEIAVIDELSKLPPGSLILNDLRMDSGRYIHFEGKPLMTAQVDTLAITSDGVFVIEVKNWSREFARSGEGFNPYEQASRASYLVFDRLRNAGVSARVRAIIATNGSLPVKRDSKVPVVPIGRLRRYIEGAPQGHVDVPAVRTALGV